jgi:hypothetical protein
MAQITFPDGKRFAFTILDDTDGATVDELRPIYTLLDELGLRTTRTIWPVACPEGSRQYGNAPTLDDPKYLEFILELRDRGFEFASGGATMETSSRERTLAGLERFREVIGYYPRVHANHAFNRENLYWGPERVDQPLLKAVVQRAAPSPAGYFLGHIQDSPFWWGDLCLKHIEYVRNLTFDEVNLWRINPSMPYHDPARPFVRRWFSCADAEDVTEFNQLLKPERQEKLERDGGCCIVSTHLGKGFVRGGQIDRLARKRLESLAARDGWFMPVGTVLDYLRAHGVDNQFSTDEWDRMQWKWARDLVRRRLRQTRKSGEERISA